MRPLTFKSLPIDAKLPVANVSNVDVPLLHIILGALIKYVNSLSPLPDNVSPVPAG